MKALTAALEPEFGTRQGVPPLPRRPLRQGQDALQDPPGRVRRGRPVDRLVRRARRARRARRRRVLRGRPARGWPRSATAIADEQTGRRSSRLADQRSRRTASRSAASSSRPRRAGTTPTTPASTCCAASSCSSAGPTASGFEADAIDAGLVDRVRADWQALRPLVSWLRASRPAPRSSPSTCSAPCSTPAPGRRAPSRDRRDRGWDLSGERSTTLGRSQQGAPARGPPADPLSRRLTDGPRGGVRRPAGSTPRRPTSPGCTRRSPTGRCRPTSPAGVAAVAALDRVAGVGSSPTSTTTSPD